MALAAKDQWIKDQGLTGKSVRHIEYGWTGKIAVGGHTDEMLMIIWDSDNGASAWPPEALEWI